MELEKENTEAMAGFLKTRNNLEQKYKNDFADFSEYVANYPKDVNGILQRVR